MNRTNLANASSDGDRASVLIEYARSQVAPAKKPGRADGLPFFTKDTVPGYELGDFISPGGQGVVYRAVQKSTGKHLAIKFMAVPLSGSLDKSRFRREVKALARIDNPNIVSIRDSGVVGAFCYVVMDYVPGESLSTYADGKLGVRDALQLMRRIAEAVHAAHLRGIIHRDLKPSNIRVTPDGGPRILDFGLARIVADDDGAPANPSVVTVSGQFVGSLPWASPEQVSGDGQVVDLRSDVYSLGVVLFQLLTGFFPYPVTGNMKTVVRSILDVEPTKPRTFRAELDDDVETIILKCLQKEPGRRYQSAGDLADDIESYLAGRPIRAKSNSTWYLLTKTVRRHRALALAAAVLLTITIAYAVATTVLLRRTMQAEREKARFAEDARAKLRFVQATLSNVLNQISTRLGELSGGSAVQKAILEDVYKDLNALAQQGSEDPELLPDRGRLMYMLGDVALRLGDTGRGLEHLREALDIRERLVALRPDDNELRSELSINHVRIGDGLGDRGEDEERRRYYERALGIDVELVRREPGNVHFLDNLYWSYLRCEVEAGIPVVMRPDSVEKQYALAKKLVELDPENLVRYRALSSATAQFSSLADERGDWDRALTLLQEECAVRERLVEQHPDNVEYLSQLANRDLTYADAARSIGDSGTVRERTQKAMAIAERLVREEPENVRLKVLLGNALYNASELAQIEGDRLTQAAYLARAQTILEPLALEAPEFAGILAGVLSKQAEFAYNSGEESSARSLAQRALQLRREQAQRPSAKWQHLTSLALLLLYAVPPDLRDSAEAVAVDERAVEMTGGRCPTALHQLAIALVADGQMERAVEARNQALAFLPSEDCPMRRELDRQWNDSLAQSSSATAVTLPAMLDGSEAAVIEDCGDQEKNPSESIKKP